MKTYGIYMNGKKSGTVKTNDIHGYASKFFPQGYEVDGNKLIAGSITLGAAMGMAMRNMKDDRPKATVATESTQAKPEAVSGLGEDNQT